MLLALSLAIFQPNMLTVYLDLVEAYALLVLLFFNASLVHPDSSRDVLLVLLFFNPTPSLLALSLTLSLAIFQLADNE